MKAATLLAEADLMAVGDLDGLLAANDPLLRPMIVASTEGERRAAMEAVLVRHARPLVAKVLSRQRYAGRLLRGDHAEDIASAVMVRLVRRLHLVPYERAEAIERLEDFTASLVFNEVHDFLRQHFPERTRLKSRVRHTLKRDGRFRTWSSPRGAACALASVQTNALARAPRGWSHDDPARIGDAIASLLETAGGSLLVAEVVDVLADAWGVVEARATADVYELADRRALHTTQFENRRRLEALWMEILALPARQRTALLLNLRDGDGANAIALFALTGVASLNDVAAAIELPTARIAQLWNRLPLDDHAIASILGVTRQQVINLRASARQRLARRTRNQ